MNPIRINLGKVLAPVFVAAVLFATKPVAADDDVTANSLEELRRHFSSCLAKTSLPPGSQVTIRFALRRDGTAFGKPRISYSRLNGDSDEGRRFLVETAKAIDSCLPLKVTPALGAAIAGRLFSLTIGGPKPQRAI
jgi:hypothetical protein